MSPEYLIPPSAMRGIPFFDATAEHFMIAVIWGTPTPAMTRVVQIDPGPTPTFTQSAPALISASVPSPVATFPAISCTLGKFFRSDRTVLITSLEWPCAVSTQRRSAPAFRSFSTRSSQPVPTPTAAPTLRRPFPSLQAKGYFLILRMSLIVMRPRRLFLPSTTSSFSIRFLCRISFACSSVVPTGTVTRSSLVITLEIGWSKFVSNLKSRFVRIPTSFPLRVTGSPEIRYLFITSSASWTLWSGSTVMGSMIIPLSDFFTRSTSTACSSAVLFR